ncbi:dUTP diphosphatase [Cytobacillus oceanisediminis]|uniref:dUTP diphosphatase n=1 Tax=Cytobacillus oceanisediminis TaxID=665099 RepID=UPI003736514C
MILKELFDLQIELDHAIAKNLNIENDFNNVYYVDKRVFALKVEVAEFANEVGFFKYWKQSHQIDRVKTLEELADVIHFFLSVGISRKYTFVKELDSLAWKKVPMEQLFQYLLNNNFDSSGKWKNGFEQLICIGFKLGYTANEMIQAYKSKREINFKRQEESY